MNKLYVGNLPYSITDSTLSDMFNEYGNIVAANVIVDRASGRSKGFGFVEFETAEEANAALEAMNQTELEGRALLVSIARPKEDKPRNFKSGGGNRGGFNRR